ncbi:unnamed protein product [Psylliodes chrysocephalus]|uniref:Uncharacterized protein n=1 Tax=Psylliodes chrysocephalus TaxID=3402493 RepID=A0A9P0D694_9CUCU|nr:unnamed protein product [Psylliodes chrysocephala]
MFTFLLVISIAFCVTKCDLEIIDAGILPIQEDDMAIIFYLTLKNQCDKNLEISVTMNECCDQSKLDENNCNMYLIGGYMGILKMMETRNVTLINPNLYTFFRKGTCSISVLYRSSKFERVLTKIIDFQTNSSEEGRDICPTCDTDPADNCNQVDCVIKYFGERSYFNPTTKECENVPICLNDPTRDPNELIGYSWLTNNCLNLNNSVTKYDLEYLENNLADSSENDMILMNNVICHHGELGTDGDCLCAGTWRTSLFEDDVYEPSLFLYHMCNIEPGGWNCVNRNRIEATALIIAILSFTVATKVLILMCILNWCYKHFKKSKKSVICTENPDDFDKSLIMSDYSKDSSSRCICSDLKKTRFSTMSKENVDISYYPGGRAGGIQYCAKSESVVKGPDYSIHLSNSSSSGTVQSIETESDACSCTEETSDYEIDFTGEEEECICPEVPEKQEDKEDNGSTDEIEDSKQEDANKKLKFSKSDSSEKVDM